MSSSRTTYHTYIIYEGPPPYFPHINKDGIPFDLAPNHIFYYDDVAGVSRAFPFYGSFLGTYLTLRACKCNNNPTVARMFNDLFVYYWNQIGLQFVVNKDHFSVKVPSGVCNGKDKIEMWIEWNDEVCDDEWDIRMYVALLDGVEMLEREVSRFPINIAHRTELYSTVIDTVETAIEKREASTHKD